MYAIIATGGKQYKVAEGDVIKVEKLGVEAGETVTFDNVIAVSNDGLKVGEDVKDASTNFFFHALSRGTYVIEYPVWVNQSGIYQDGIAIFQSIYAPEYNSFSNASRIEVKN